MKTHKVIATALYPVYALACFVLMIIAIALILVNAALADVALTVLTKPSVEVPCPGEAPRMLPNVGGTYTRVPPVVKPTHTCFTAPVYSFEVWTDYPERGGKYVSTIGTSAQSK